MFSAPDKRNTTLFIDTSQTPPAPPKRLVKKVSGSMPNTFQLRWFWNVCGVKPSVPCLFVHIAAVLFCVVGHHILQRK
jgi:hypothetical protein